MASLLPLYLREYYKEEPLFTESKIVTSIYSNGFEGNLNQDLVNKVNFDFSNNEKTEILKNPNNINIIKSAIENSDAIIYGSSSIEEEISSYVESKNVPFLAHEEENMRENYLNFYADLLAED